jgi:hypothetical protein
LHTGDICSIILYIILWPRLIVSWPLLIILRSQDNFLSCGHNLSYDHKVICLGHEIVCGGHKVINCVNKISCGHEIMWPETLSCDQNLSSWGLKILFRGDNLLHCSCKKLWRIHRCHSFWPTASTKAMTSVIFTSVQDETTSFIV